MLDDKQRSELITAFFRFKKINTSILNNKTLRMNELMAMAMIEDSFLVDKDIPLVAAIGERMSITQSAVSQLFASLEKKGYMKRGIHEQDKRKYHFELTESGRQVTKGMMAHAQKIFEQLSVRLGAAKLQELIQILNEYSETAEQIQNEI